MGIVVSFVVALICKKLGGDCFTWWLPETLTMEAVLVSDLDTSALRVVHLCWLAYCFVFGCWFGGGCEMSRTGYSPRLAYM